MTVVFVGRGAVNNGLPSLTTPIAGGFGRATRR